MSPDSIPQLSLGTAALIIFLVCAGFVMLRGMTRMIVGTVVLALNAWIGFLVWQKAPTLSVMLLGKSVGIITTGLPLLVFLVSFYLIRRIAKAVASPFGKPPGEGKKSTSPVIKLAFRLLLALIPTSIIWLIGATFIHHTGTIAELRVYAEKSLGIDQATSARFSQQLKTSVEAALPEAWLRFLDPLADPDRLTLAKLVTARAEYQPAIDPQTGKPIPRAIIVEDPELQNLAREGKFGTLLRHPLLTQALEDPQIKALLKDLQL